MYQWSTETQKTNLNFFKWITAGHIILRGWCENPNACSDDTNFPLEQKKSRCSQKNRAKQHENHAKRTSNRDNKIVLWFEVDDTGCGMFQTGKIVVKTIAFVAKEISFQAMVFFFWHVYGNLIFTFIPFIGIDPSKWESVFESFEQADPSTTRL